MGNQTVKKLTVAITSTMFFHTMEVNGYRQCVWLNTFFKIDFFCAKKKNKETLDAILCVKEKK